MIETEIEISEEIITNSVNVLEFVNPEISLFWDLTYTIPCCEEYPKKLMEFVNKYGRITNAVAFVREDLVLKHMKEVEESGFKISIGKDLDEKYGKFIDQGLRETNMYFVISGDENFLEYLKNIPEIELILLSDPLLLSSYTKINITYFYLCDCRVARVLRERWCQVPLERYKIGILTKIGKWTRKAMSGEIDIHP